MIRPVTVATALIVSVTLFAGPAGAQSADELAAPEAGGEFVVENGNDSGPGSYRQAVADASADPEDDVIKFDDEIVITLTSGDVAYTGAGTTLTLLGNGATIDGGSTHQLLEAASAKSVTVDNLVMANGSTLFDGGAIEVTSAEVMVTDSRFIANAANVAGAIRSNGGDITAEDTLFEDNTATLDGGAIQTNLSTVHIRDSVLTGNTAVRDGGAIATDNSPIVIEDSALTGNEATDDGGAVAAIDADVTVTRSSAVGNSADDNGGAILTSTGDVDVADSRMEDNRSGANGGAVFNFDGSVDASDSAFTLNAAEDNGGAIRNDNGPVTVSDSSFHLNSAGRGGAVFDADGALIATNSTFTDNEAQLLGGGIRTASATGDVQLTHVTMAANESPAGANLSMGPGTLTAENTVIAEPAPSQANCVIGGGTTSTAHNYDTDGTCGFGAGLGDVSSGDDPLLGPARSNGDLGTGSSSVVRLTAFPLNGSPLIDAIPTAMCSAAPELAVDERGIDRPFGAGCDIGAIEAVFPGHGFTDVTPFYEATVRWITSPINTPNILDGYGDGTFRQTLNITRGQTARMYYRAAGQPDVSGLPPHGLSDVTTFFEDAVRWAKANDIFDGYDDGTFRQANSITRGNYVRSLYGFAGSPDVSGLPGHGFSDVTPFYENAVRWAKANGIADGFNDGTFRQTDNISRGNASRTAYNLAGTPSAWEPEGDGPPNMLFSENVMFM